MGDCQNRDLRVQFDRRLKLKFLGSKVTTDAGLLAYRELDEALGLTEMSEEVLADSRLGSNKQHKLVPLLRQSIYSRLAAYEDVNDAERLAIDPAMRYVVGGRATLADKYLNSLAGTGAAGIENTPLANGAFGSFHPGGGQFVFGDGRVTFISSSIELLTYRALSTRSGKETIAMGVY